MHLFYAGKDFTMNNIILSGTLDFELKLGHETESDILYQTTLSVKRGIDQDTSEAIINHIPLMVSSYALAPYRGKLPVAGSMVKAEGELRLATYYGQDGESRTQEIYILVTDLSPLAPDALYENSITVTGKIIRPARYSSHYDSEGRIQETSSLSIAVPFGQNDRFVYVTVFSNGRAARATRYYVKGDTLKVVGHLRLEDRNIVSKSTGETKILRIGYIISRNIQVIDYTTDDTEETIDSSLDFPESDLNNDGLPPATSSDSDIAIPDID